MSYKQAMGWKNSNYGYIYHLVASCHTPEEAHRVLSETIGTVKMAIREYQHAIATRAVQKEKLRRSMDNSEDHLEKAELALEIEKLNIHEEIESADYAMAKQEVEFVSDALSRLEPHCNWTKLGISREEGYQLAQQEERRLVLLERARIGLLSQGVVDSETMRETGTHPQGTKIWEEIQSMMRLRQFGTLNLLPTSPVFLLKEDNNKP